MSMNPKCPVNVRLVSALVSSNCKLGLIELTYLLWKKKQTNEQERSLVSYAFFKTIKQFKVCAVYENNVNLTSKCSLLSKTATWCFNFSYQYPITVNIYLLF